MTTGTAYFLKPILDHAGNVVVTRCPESKLKHIDGKADWPSDKDATIVVYCGSGHRSTIAMTILWTYGYNDVRSLKGGFSGWVEAGYPTVEYAMP